MKDGCYFHKHVNYPLPKRVVMALVPAMVTEIQKRVMHTFLTNIEFHTCIATYCAILKDNVLFKQTTHILYSKEMEIRQLI